MDHGTEMISNLGPKIWDLMPNNLKERYAIEKKLKKPLNSGNLRIALTLWTVQSFLQNVSLPGKIS